VTNWSSKRKDLKKETMTSRRDILRLLKMQTERRCKIESWPKRKQRLRKRSTISWNWPPRTSRHILTKCLRADRCNTFAKMKIVKKTHLLKLVGQRAVICSARVHLLVLEKELPIISIATKKLKFKCLSLNKRWNEPTITGQRCLRTVLILTATSVTRLNK